jgi:antitoxin component YwqK of YwqJK toxin-antitoxin module
MFTRMARRKCGLVLSLLAIGSPLRAGAEQELIDLATDAAAPAVIQLDSTPLEATKPLQVHVGATEKVVERYPNRTVKIERYVAQDDQGNFFNHGPWAKWNEQGQLMGRGTFVAGAQSGKWVRFYSEEETEEAFASALNLGFEAPFSSTGEFAEGKLHGMWIVLDAKKRQVSAGEFNDGRRHGKSVSWRPDGKKFRELEYHLGELDGKAVEYGTNEVPVKQEEFVQGFRHAVKVERYPTGEVKSECEMLFAKEIVEARESWWQGTTTVKVVGSVGRDQRHGKYVAWNLEGQKVLEGNYTDDKADGKFTWYHENGNKAIEGAFVAGKQDGPWTWWYSHGLKEISGEYVMGVEGGNWRAWEENGQVVSSMTILTGAESDAALQSTDEPKLKPAELTTELKEADLESKPEQIEFHPPTPPDPARRVVYQQVNAEKSSLKLGAIENAASDETVKIVAKPNVKAAVETKETEADAAAPQILEAADDLISIDDLLEGAKK